jgi:hypothetical protein
MGAEAPPLVHATGGLDQLVQGRPNRKFVGAWALYVTGDAVELGAGVALIGADRAEPLATTGHDVGHVAQSLDVVDDRGRVEGADQSGEGGLDPGLSPPPFERLEHPGLLTTDVGACAAVDPHVQLETGAQGAVTQDSRLVGFGDGSLQDLRLPHILTADVDVAGVCPHGVAAQGAALDQLMGVALHQHPILEGTGLRLVGVADQIFCLLALLGDKAPLDPGGETGATPAA